MTPRITLIILGRTNAGKSTLFNRLVGRRRNIVHDAPGVTRDFLEQTIERQGVSIRLIDTAGFEPNGSWSYPEVQEGIRTILGEADALLYVIDGNEAVNPIDQDALRALKKTGVPIWVGINKIDGAKRETAASIFYELGLPKLHFISAEHGNGISDLLEDLLAPFIPQTETEEDLPPHLRIKQRRKVAASEAKATHTAPKKPSKAKSLLKIAIVGRPNVGKSTLSNTLYGGHRMVVSKTPGTTRDSVEIPVTHNGKLYTFIDTAGIRRPGRREDFIERVSVLRSFRELEDANVVLWVIDGERGLEEQDKRVLGAILEERKPFVILCNKWDAMLAQNPDVPPRELEKRFREMIEDECSFVSYAPIVMVSAETGFGVDAIFEKIDMLYAESQLRVSTGEVNRRLERIFTETPPPTKAGKPVRIFYGTQVAYAPPTFVFFANYPEYIENSYRRFLENAIRRDFDFSHIPILIQVRGRGKKTAE